MKFKDIKLEIKQVSEQGQFEGYAAAFGNVDLGGDILMAGAFTKTIAENTSRPLLWAHDLREPIGLTTVSEDSKGLIVDGRLNLDVGRAREIHSLVKQGAVKGLSFGFDPVVKTWNKGIRELREVKLYEVSLVPVPMNPEARVTAVKSTEDFEDVLQLLLNYKSAEPLSPEVKGLIEQVKQNLSTLQAAQAPEAVTQDEIAPEVLHAASSIEQLLLKENLRGN